MDDLKHPSGLPGYPDFPSPRSTIFRSPNSIPTPAEASYIQDLLTITQSELHQLHLDIAILLAKRAHISKRITNYEAILSPHKKLPSELISNIFSFVVTERYAVFPLRHGKLDSRLRITQICSRWRRIAFDTPDLWDLFFPPYPQSCEIELGASWWSQYSGSKLRLSDMYQPTLVPLSRKDSILVDKLILAFSERLRIIGTAVSAGDLKKLLSAPPGSFNNLEEITMWVDSRNIEPCSETDTALMSAHKLRSVTLCVHTHSWLSPNFPWGQLTQLTLTMRIPPDACFVILAKCISLVTCNFSYIDEKFGSVTGLGPLPDFPLCLPLLDSFSVSFRSGGFSSLLSRLSLPNLSEFRIITCITHRKNDWTRHCKEFFESTKESLRHVEIASSAENPRHVIPLDEAIFWDFPNIRSFIAPWYHPISASTLEMVAQGKLLRKIEVLEFHTENAVDVVNLLTARQPDALPASSSAITPIKKIEVNCIKTAAGVEDKLKEFRSQGIFIDCILPYDDPHTTNED